MSLTGLGSSLASLSKTTSLIFTLNGAEYVNPRSLHHVHRRQARQVYIQRYSNFALPEKLSIGNTDENAACKPVWRCSFILLSAWRKSL